MKERPILMSAPMVRAILAGQKTVTRRVVKPMPGEQAKWLTPGLINSVPHGEMIKGGWQMHHPRADTHYEGVDVAHDSPLGWIKSPYGSPGDLLWCRETFRPYRFPGQGMVRFEYLADGVVREISPPLGKPYLLSDDDEKLEGDQNPKRWIRCKVRPSIFMPRWASRITLEVVSVRVERLNDIGFMDCIAEGIDGYNSDGSKLSAPQLRGRYQHLWNSINGPGSWEANPFVWRVEFKATP